MDLVVALIPHEINELPISLGESITPLSDYGLAAPTVYDSCDACSRSLKRGQKIGELITIGKHSRRETPIFELHHPAEEILGLSDLAICTIQGCLWSQPVLVSSPSHC